jgi:hypothetical protein
VTAESGRAATRDRLHATEVWPVAGGLALMIALGIVTVALSPRLPRRALNALALLNVLIAAFLLLIILTPPAQRRAWLAVAIFAGLIGLFKLMGRFEAPER